MSKKYYIDVAYKDVISCLIYFSIVFWIHYNNIFYLVAVDWNRTDFDYCILVPFIFLLIVFKRRFCIINTQSVPAWSGLFVVGLGGALSLVGELAGEYLLSYFALWTLVIGFFQTLWGSKKMAKVFSCFVLLLTMFPPPEYLYARMTLKMQLVSSVLAEKILHLAGIPAYREGNIIDVGTSKIQVVAACSGLRYLIPVFLVSFTMTLLMNTRKKIPKIFLVLVSIPLAIGMNGLRLACTGYLTREHGSWAIEGVYHDLIGWVFFGISIVILLGIMSLLDRSPAPSAPGKRLGLRFIGFGSMRILDGRNISVLIALCMVGTLLVFLSFRKMSTTFSTNAMSFHSFPLHVGGWNGQRSVLPMDTLNALNSSNYALIDYEDRTGNSINLYIIHYAQQTKGSSIHSPETCFRGGGWQFKQSDRVEIFKNYHVNRSILAKHERHVLSYFWFLCRGRNLTNAMELKFYNFWDRLISGRSDGSLVRVVTPIMKGDVDSADARLKNFIQQLAPILNSYVDNNT